MVRDIQAFFALKIALWSVFRVQAIFVRAWGAFLYQMYREIDWTDKQVRAIHGVRDRRV